MEIDVEMFDDFFGFEKFSEGSFCWIPGLNALHRIGNGWFCVGEYAKNMVSRV